MKNFEHANVPGEWNVDHANVETNKNLRVRMSGAA